MPPSRSVVSPKDTDRSAEHREPPGRPGQPGRKVRPEHRSRHRAAPLPPDERRASIVCATIPLLIEHGAQVTTRQIAEAAGIAEGTIFRVFADKESLVEAAIETAFDPGPLDVALRAVDRSLELEARLCIAAAIVQRRAAAIWQLMAAVGMSKPPAGTRSRDGSGDGRHRLGDSTALAELFEPDRDRLRRDPAASAELFRGLIFATSHPALAAQPLDPAEIVSVLLHGIDAGSGTTPSTVTPSGTLASPEPLDVTC